jgi:hypothetical protein
MRPARAWLAAAALAACSSEPARRPAEDRDRGAPRAVAPARPGGVAEEAAARPGARGAPPPAPATAAIAAPPPALPLEESFTLVAAGAAPRAALRYGLVAGAAEHAAETRLVMRDDAPGGGATELVLPAIRDGLRVELVGAGQLAVRALPVAIDAAASAAARERAEQYTARWRAGRAAAGATVAIDDRGRIARAADAGPARVDPPGPATDDLVQRLLAVIVPLPAEAIGIGARWRVVTVLRQGPVAVKQTAEYALTARAPGGWRIRVALRRVAEPQPLADPSLPAGATAELAALLRRLDGALTVDPRRAVAARGALTVESRLHARVLAPGAAAPVEQLFEDTGTIALITRP